MDEYRSAIINNLPYNYIYSLIILRVKSYTDFVDFESVLIINMRFYHISFYTIELYTYHEGYA